MDEFEQGESIGLTILLSENAAGTIPIDTSTLLTIGVLVRHKYRNTDAGTYSLVNGKLVKLSPTADGEVFCDIPPSVSTTLNIGIYEYQITTTETNTDYDGNVRTRMFIDTCFKLNRKKV